MSLARLKDLLCGAQQGGYAVGMFVFNDLAMIRGMIEAAEACGAPLLMAYGELGEDQMSIRQVSPAVLRMIEAAKVPIGLHWDHASSYQVAKLAVESGFTSVMIDASAKPLEENIALTQKVVELCRPLSIDVEGELGSVGQGANYDPGTYRCTDPDEAAYFVRETGVDALAVAIGNSHGVYACEPKINFEALAAIRNRVQVPLVLHGASGIPDTDVQKCIRGGITKVNIFTDMCMEIVRQLREDLEEPRVSYPELTMAAAGATRRVCEQKIRLFGSAGKAGE